MSAAPRRRRPGFTLVEISIALVLLGLVGAMVMTLLVRQQRLHRAVADATEARTRMRDIATILPTDLRSISSIGNDILDIGLTHMQFRASLGSAVLCRFAGGAVIDLPPQNLASGNVLAAWINPPQPGDVAYLYDDGTQAGNVDDSWTQFTIADTASAANPLWCPAAGTPPFTTVADNGQRRYRLTLNAAPDPTRIRVGAPIRFAREVRYSLYQAADGDWYVGYQRCTPAGAPGVPGPCGDREVLAGPVLPATTDTTTSGLYFVYYNQNGGRITTNAQASQIARVDVGVRTGPLSIRGAAAGRVSAAGRDSLRISVGIRNRI